MFAWTLVALGVLLWCAAIWLWMRGPWPLRLWLCLLMPVWALCPAPVENHPDAYAPAIFAAFYELFIAPDGNPGVAIALLVLGTVVLTLVVGMLYLARRYFAKSDTA